MHFKSIQSVSDKIYNLEFPERKCVVLEGYKDDKEYILSLVKVILSLDYNCLLDGGSLKPQDLDKINADIRFTYGSLVLRDGVVTKKGKVPLIHCVYSIGTKGVSSFLVSETTKNVDIGTDMTKYSEVLDISEWTRLFELFNRYAGFECITLATDSEGQKELRFINLTEELKTVYLLISESFLTPSDYLRVVLLSDLANFSSEKMVKLIDALTSISRLELVITSADISIEDYPALPRVCC